MLIISRKTGERIVIDLPGGKQAVVTVVDVGPGRIRLGVEAPKDVPVFRQEIQPGRTPSEPSTP